jgi:hypothetical protein
VPHLRLGSHRRLPCATSHTCTVLASSVVVHYIVYAEILHAKPWYLPGKNLCL